MSENSFLLKVYSPSGLVFEESVASVTVPGEGGEFGVYPRHARYIGTLGTGLMKFETVRGDTGQIAVAGGFARMKEEEFHILADYVVLPEDAAAMSVEDERARLEEELDRADTNTPEYAAAKAQYLRLRAVEDLQRAC